MHKPIFRNLSAKLAISPSVIIALVFYIGCILWTVYISFTKSGLLPEYTLVGLEQYLKLFANLRWRTAFTNMFIFGGLFILGSLIIGLVLAILVDQNIKFERQFKTIYMYPLALSFIVTGLAWRWFLNPTFGLQAFVRNLGFESFRFDWLGDSDKAIYTLVFAAIWQSSGLVMAIMLAGLRGIDEEIWKATRVDGISPLKVYLHIIIPMLRPMILTSVVLLAISVVKSYDLVIALTKGGPGIASDLPAKFVIDLTIKRSQLGMGSAAAVVMIFSVFAILLPYLFVELRRRDL